MFMGFLLFSNILFSKRIYADNSAIFQLALQKSSAQTVSDYKKQKNFLF